MGDGLLVVDRDGAALLSNPALRRMLGLKENENVPKNCARECGFFHADKVTRIEPEETPTSRAVAGENIDEDEIFIRHGANSEGSWAHVTARALRDEQGIIHGAVAVFHDITAHKRAVEQQHDRLFRPIFRWRRRQPPHGARGQAVQQDGQRNGRQRHVLQAGAGEDSLVGHSPSVLGAPRAPGQPGACGLR